MNAPRWSALVFALTLASCARTGLEEGAPSTSGAYAVDAALDTFGFDVTPGVSADTPPDIRTDVASEVCGDGIVGPTEQCDDGDANSDIVPDACRTDCRLPRCGDGVVDMGETCDDGNDNDDDACDNQCRGPAESCLPCATSNECGRSIDHCARLRDGSFCAPACQDGECGPGLTCSAVPAQGIDGLIELCVPELQVCAGCFDRDGDGYGIGLECLGPDCDDSNPAVNPGATEICNDIDDDCDGNNDEGCPPDLIIDAERVTLSGPQRFDRVEIRNGGVLEVPAPESGSCDAGAGCLDLSARLVLIAPNSGINATGAGVCDLGAGFEAGAGRGLPNIGPGGGGYGGQGGAGGGRPGGRPYGTASDTAVLMGSPGGSFSIIEMPPSTDACGDLRGLISEGGNGGGCVRIQADDIRLNGYIRANGEAGQAAPDGRAPNIVDGAAGGSGGGISLSSQRLTFGDNSQLSAVGGEGGRGGRYRRQGGGDQNECVGNGAGGGGGGRIVLESAQINGRPPFRVQGGAGGSGPQSNATGGADGTAIVR